MCWSSPLREVTAYTSASGLPMGPGDDSNAFGTGSAQPRAAPAKLRPAGQRGDQRLKEARHFGRCRTCGRIPV